MVIDPQSVEGMHDSGTRRGLALFNSADFFDAHEALEDVWREAPRHSRRRRHLQGLVQLAVAFHHQSTGNRVGARSVLERALRNVEGAEESFPEVDWERLRTNLKPWREYLADARRKPEDRSPPELPKVLLRHQSR
jgi:predicted metal-dependent hydrolase